MGIDGFSMGNLGLNNELTSVQMATQADQLAQKGNEFIIKDIKEMAEDGGVKRKEENDESDGKNNRRFKKKKNQNEDEKNHLAEIELENKDPKEFTVRLNPETELVELYNTKEEKVLQTIPPKDLMELISKLDNASGILVNRKI